MKAAAVAKTIAEKSRELISELNADLKTNLGTSHYHRLSDEELLRRGTAVFQGLTQWLDTQEESALQKYGEDLGKHRFTEGIPLGQVVLAFILIEKHIWAFLDASAETVEADVRRDITECFQKIAYYTAKGYEASLAASNRHAKRSPVGQFLPDASQVPPRKEVGKEARKDQDVEISRGGQVGELGG